MSYTIEYFNEAVRVEIDLWPPSLLARYRALTMRMVEHGPNLGMPHTRAMGEGLSEIRVKGKEGIGGPSTAICTVVILLFYTALSRKLIKPRRGRSPLLENE